MVLSKKTVYDKLAIKVNAVDTKIPRASRLITKTRYDSDKEDLEKNIKDVDKKIPSTSGRVKKNNYNTKITDIENKIPNVTGF